MNFHIEQLIVRGAGKLDAVMNFKKGLNLIIGPSNSGKSLIIDCIDYALGYEHKEKGKADSRYRLDSMKINYGYDTILLTIITPNGKLTLTRILRDNFLMIKSTDTNITSGRYSVGHSARLNTSALMLQLLGINDYHEILSTVKGKKNALTWRSISHLFIVKQEDVARASSPIITPAAPTVSKVSSPSALLFLLTGIDYHDIVKEKVDPQKDTKDKGVIEYLEAKINELEDEKAKALETEQQNTLQSGITEFATSVDELRAQINEGISESKAIMDEIYVLDADLSECRIMEVQFKSLRTQYQSDIDRMTFIVKGELAMAEIPEKHICPFCGNPAPHIATSSYIESARNNLEHIKRHLNDLNVAENGLRVKIEKLEEKKNELLSKKKTIDSDVKRLTDEKSFMLRIQAYTSKLLSMRTSQQIEAEQKRTKEELIDKKSKKSTNQQSYHITDWYSSNVLNPINTNIVSILKAINFPQASTALLNTDTWDVQFGGLVKAGIAGGGYTSIANSALILALNETLNTNVPILLDSSLTALSEPEYMDIGETIKVNFINYLMKHNGQIILAEQKEKMPESILQICSDAEVYDGNNYRIVQFSHDLDHGRVGFFPEVLDF